MHPQGIKSESTFTCVDLQVVGSLITISLTPEATDLLFTTFTFYVVTHTLASQLHKTFKFQTCLSATPRWLMAHPAAQIPPQFVFKASASRLDVIVSLALTDGLISVAFAVEMARPVRKCLAL